jgi:SM-20-related protein
MSSKKLKSKARMGFPRLLRVFSLLDCPAVEPCVGYAGIAFTPEQDCGTITMPTFDFSGVLDDLAEHGWSLQQDFLPPALVGELAVECRLRAQTPAAVGRSGVAEIRQAVRGDRIHWLEQGQSAAGDAWLQQLEVLRLQLNQGLFLGLEDFEGHFALYPPGSFYQKHLDRFHDDDRRSISVVLYLNQGWQVEDGGAVRLYLDRGERDLLPLAGNLLLFNSAQLAHEVLPARRERLSLTGWFRRRGMGPL